MAADMFYLKAEKKHFLYVAKQKTKKQRDASKEGFFPVDSAFSTW